MDLRLANQAIVRVGLAPVIEVAAARRVRNLDVASSVGDEPASVGGHVSPDHLIQILDVARLDRAGGVADLDHQLSGGILGTERRQETEDRLFVDVLVDTDPSGQGLAFDVVLRRAEVAEYHPRLAA